MSSVPGAKARAAGGSSRQHSKASKRSPPKALTAFDHAQARLKWARASRDSKIDKMRHIRSEMQALKKAMDVKAIEIKMLKEERVSANERVQAERHAYREQLVDVLDEIENQLDPRILEGYSSDIAFLRSSPFTELSTHDSDLDDVEEEAAEDLNTQTVEA
ncbi:hypothetical protein SCHPADRAFT_937522 [Schizopora paradoxa]|uniref:Uncharacterized protein n=1 Tax=Schizopora paradoxa TaxID=27342 RepID=A0A0H2S559_9AGAM|nr:hypothetical protein SCHPADRAFT_937522 [Schizopora paradoxa]